MAEPTEPGGLAKLAAAQAAATLFVNLMNFPDDQADIHVWWGTRR